MKEKKSKVHYIGQYNIPKFYKQGRMFSPAASKALYIIRVLNELGHKVNFLSFTNSRYKKYCRVRTAKLNPMTRFYLAPYLPIERFTERFMFLWLFVYAFFHIRKGDILLVWHTNSMRNDLLEKIVRWKKMQFIYEVEEVFTLANRTIDNKLVNDEINFLQCPHKYIFNNPTLSSRVNLRNLPQAICHGEYLPTTISDTTKESKSDIINCVYAGIIDTVKGGAFRAVNAAKYLPPSYTINILGFGAKDDIDELNKLISEVNKGDNAKVQFLGRKSGKEYIDFIKNCDIALGLQDMNGAFNNTSFPSKLFVYLGVGLRTVAPHIQCIYDSPISELMSYYYEDTPQAIAEAIRNIDFSHEFTPSIILNKLHTEFKTNISNLLSNSDTR